MKAKHQRAWFVGGSLLVAALAIALMLHAFSDSLVFFYTPTQWAEKSAAPGFDASRPVRLGGLVEKGSITHAANGALHFTITDLNATMPVTYRGFVPSLFREEQGVVAQGVVEGGTLRATTILAKHDENYMPKEVVEALKQSGQWKP
jgi:cytochrome c-type biogenesis protein CcmE